MNKEMFERSGIRGEERVKEVLEKVCPGRYIHDLLFRYYGVVQYICSAQIDFMCILDKYIYVIEVKNWNSITKYDQKNDIYYIPIIKKNRHMSSPLKQNENHRRFLSDFLGIDPRNVVCLSVICTDDSSDQKYVHDRNPYHFKQSHVIRLDQLEEKILFYENNASPKNVSYEQVWSEVERASWPNVNQYKNYHQTYCDILDSLYNKRKSDILNFKLLRCDSCSDGHLVVREKAGQFFLGCSNYNPQNGCRKTDDLENAKNYADNDIEDNERLIYYMSLADYEKRKNDINCEVKEMSKQLHEIEELLEEKKRQLIATEKLIETNKELADDGKTKQIASLEKTVENYKGKNYALSQKIELLEQNNKNLVQLNENMEQLYEDLKHQYDKMNRKYLKTFTGKLMSYIGKI